MTEIRCPKCHRMLGKMDDAGTVEARGDRRCTIRLREGALLCVRCNREVVVTPPILAAEMRAM